MRNPLLGAAILSAVAAATASAGDWPQILGPARDGVAVEESLADRWPAAGPAKVWSRPVGAGYAGVAGTAERLVLFHRVDDREVVEALDPATGAAVWRQDHPTSFAPQVGGNSGPLCVPLIAGSRVVTYGAQGVLSCDDLVTGERLWQRPTHREFDAQEGYFGAGSSPILVGDTVVVNVGGKRGESGVVGFAIADGATRWSVTQEPASYAAPTRVDLDGVPHVLMVTRYAALLLDPATGAVRWRFPFGQRGPTVNAATPLVFPDGHLLVTASYGIGSVYAAFDAAAATPVWEGADALASQYCTPIALGDHVYAIDGRDDGPPGTLTCLVRGSGTVAWAERGFGYGTLMAADGKLIAVKTGGEAVLLRPDPTGPRALATARLLRGTIRALPALVDGRLIVRDDTTLAAFDLRK